jgi:predicted ferric reductase
MSASDSFLPGAAAGRPAPARRASARKPAIGAFELLLLFIGNAVVVAGLWLRGGELTGIDSTAALLTSVGRLTGLLGAYLVLVQLLLMARVPALKRVLSFDRLTVWHRRNGRLALILLLAHAVLITVGYALRGQIGIPRQVWLLLTTYSGVLTATASLLALIAVVVTSVVLVRRKLRYEAWYFVHLYAYLGVALAFSHQMDTGRDFIGDPVAQLYWKALYAVTLGALIGFRVAVPLARAAYHRIRVVDVFEEAPGVVTLTLTGHRLDRLNARSGQFFLFRFLTRDRWWEAHPYSLSAAPDGSTLRITVKALGDFSAQLAHVHPGTYVLAEGPFGAFTAARRSRRRAVLIAGGVGITPIRALLEDIPARFGDLTLLYRAIDHEDTIFRDELDELAHRRGVAVHYVLGDHRHPSARSLLSAGHLHQLVPDIAACDVFLCGPPPMMRTLRRSLRRAGVPARQIVTEQFAF